MAATQGCRTVLVHKTETVSIDANLLSIDLRKVVDKVTAVEANIADLQEEVVALKRKMAQMTTATRERRTQKAALNAALGTGFSEGCEG
ncbi:hypothetical protein NDU88_003881 [Pleurodeles waltl]|uniref:Uncharacterized protein n=1 Tax=Pleurodeles waltl TaxID=8319 RepID=A0AAV7W6U9_PLEWA|nr:hypothetical protein NDU88_003881 [Pleurodeles waltl]